LARQLVDWCLLKPVLRDMPTCPPLLRGRALRTWQDNVE
jgi:hypothetical protein